MRRNSKKYSNELQKQSKFISNWPVYQKIHSYNALEDQHSNHYFVLPSVRNHLKKLKKLLRKQASSQAQYLTQSITNKIKNRRHSSSIIKNNESIKQINQYKQVQNDKSRIRYRNSALNSISHRKKLEQQQNQKQKKHITITNQDSRFPQILKRNQYAVANITNEKVKIKDIKQQGQNEKKKQIQYQNFLMFLDKKREQLNKKIIVTQQLFQN